MGALTSKFYAFKARPWELETVMESVDFFDSFGSYIKVNIRGEQILRIVPNKTEFLNEGWITDKIRFAYDNLKIQRIDIPLIKVEKKFGIWSDNISKKYKPIKWEKFFKLFKKLNKFFSLQFVVGNFVDFETLFILKKFLILKDPFLLNFPIYLENKFLVDFRRNLFTFDLNNMLLSDFFFFINVNLRLESPILNLRLRKQIKKKKIKSFCLGCGFLFNFDVYNLGNNFKTLLTFFEGKHKLCNLFLKSKNPILIFGSNFIKRKDFKFLNEFFFCLKKKFNNLNFSYLSKNLSDYSLFELGIGYNVFNIILKDIKQKFQFLWIIDNDDFNLKMKDFNYIIYQGYHGDKMALSSDCILPSCAPLEKNSIYLNFEGQFRKSNLCVLPPKESREDWKILYMLLLHLNDTIKSQDLIKYIYIYKEMENYLGGFFFEKILNKFELNFKFDYYYKFNNANFFGRNFNYYLADNLSKFSVAMALASKIFFKKNYNFKRKI